MGLLCGIFFFFPLLTVAVVRPGLLSTSLVRGCLSGGVGEAAAAGRCVLLQRGVASDLGEGVTQALTSLSLPACLANISVA